MRLRVLLSPSEVSSAMEAINNLSPPPFFLPAHCVFSASLSVPLGRVLFQKQIRVVRVGFICRLTEKWTVILLGPTSMHVPVVD